MTSRIPTYSPMTPPELPRNRPPRILICAVQIPFVYGGAENHIESLRRELVSRHYEVDVVRLPLKWYPPRQIINDVLAWRFLDLTHFYGLPVDLLITTRFPSYAARHPRKIAWVLHQHRQIYDLLNTAYTDFSDSPDDDEVRGILYDLDRKSLMECRDIFTNSRNVSHRMKKYLNIDSEPLYHPPPLTGRYECREYSDVVLCAGRLELNKRVDLFIRALSCTRHPICAHIVGQGPQGDNLKNLATELGLGNRVVFHGFVPEEDLIQQYATCGAVFYAPLDEDYGYITLEAFHSGKIVLTASDSGGVLEFVEDGRTGLIAEPHPEALARILDQWFEMPDRGRKLGETGKQTIRTITWDHVINALTSRLRTEK